MLLFFQIPTSLSLPSSEVKQVASKVMTPQVSAVVPETPKQPRGILKQNDSSQKKRRVAFAGSGEPHSSSSEDNEEGVSNLTKVITTPVGTFAIVSFVM